MTLDPATRQALTDLVRLGRQAQGDHPALSEVRRIHAQHMDQHCATLRSQGVDVDALLDEIDNQLDNEETA